MAYGFNTESGAAKSSDIEHDNTTFNPETKVEEWNPEVESWEDFQRRTA